MNIYVATSWRNLLQPDIVVALRKCGHTVYDFRNPAPGVKGFAWSDIDPAWETWTAAQYRDALQHPISKRGYELDLNALKACDACVLVLPSGRSASWEMGYAVGAGKDAYVVMLDKAEPELMYRDANIITTMDELTDTFARRGSEAAREDTRIQTGKQKVLITPEMAKRWLEGSKSRFPNSAIDYERYAVETHARAMAAGRWIVTDHGILLDRNERVIDGRHRLLAIIAHGEAIEMNVTMIMKR